MTTCKVNVIGAGVIGLTTALLLQQKGYDVTIIANYFPGDKSIEYTSPIAGARWKTLAPNSDPRLQRHDAVSFKAFWELAKLHAAEAGIMVVPAFDYFEGNPTQDQLNPWWKFLVPTFQLLEKSELPDNMSFGYYYTTVVIHPLIYLPWLLKQFLNLGGKCQKRKIQSISEAITDGVDIVVNCTGIHARDLDGVKDKDVVPTRGQNVIVKAPHVRKTMSVVRSDTYTYIIPRSDGAVVLGTTKEENNANPKINANTTKDILQRAIKCCPELSLKGIKDLQILDNVVGLRPSRHGGPRIQNEFYTSPTTGKKTLVAHNYGHGGSGYQSSWGSCQEAVCLINEGYSMIENDRLKIRQLLSRL